jgi:hypothetical protein
MSTTIEVASIHPAPAGKKLAKVMTTGAESYGIWPDKMAGLKVGGLYAIEFSENEFNGRTYRKITKAEPVANGGNGHAPASATPATKPNEAEGQFVREILTWVCAPGRLPFLRMTCARR